ncbi:MAG: hypothetical protein GY945_14145 [Rhodobacteraceae bacterium]|nr:hypothetical protein [Paracoccaceae bacterium]
MSERALVLLLPTGFYTRFGAGAVALTIILTLLVPPRVFRFLLAMDHPVRRASTSGVQRNITSFAAFLIFAFLIALGMWGPRDPLVNLLPLCVFTLWWICLPLLQALLGDIWAWINPWSGPLWLVFRGRHPFELPQRLGHWPALATYLLASVYTLTDIAPDDPTRLAWVAGGYWLFTFAMAGLFGSEWLRRGEGFSVFFNLIARITPLAFGQLKLNFPGKRIVDDVGLGTSVAVFSVALLALGSFDGLNETFWWMGQIGINPLAFPGRSAVTLPNRVGLFAAVILLNLAFAFCVWIGLAFIGRSQDFHNAFCRLALTILPIAMGYHLAHYMTSAMVSLQYLVAALNDPLHSGAALLGLEDFYVTTGFLNQHHIVERIWFIQAGAIVGSHVIAVILSHGVALQVFGSHRAAIISQMPVALFMVLYTYFGLWLLASPVAL